MEYKIVLHGCDDSTYMLMELNHSEVDLVERMCKLSVEMSEYGCMPIMEIEEV